MTLDSIREYFEERAGTWNGDEPGVKEDRAAIISDILALIDELEQT
jgi:hypothetical protein